MTTNIVLKDVRIEDVRLSANQVFLARFRETERGGTISTTSTFAPLGAIENGKDITVAKTVIKALYAEYKATEMFNEENEKSKVKAPKVFSQFLNSFAILKSDSEGKISKAIISDVKLSQTCLRFHKSHNIVTCEAKNLQAAIHMHAVAFLAQTKFLSTIREIVEGINAVTETVKTKKAASKAA